jgi:hypothetical protein
MTVEELGILYGKLEEEGYSFKTIDGVDYKKVKIISIGRPDKSYGEIRYTFEEHVLHPYYLRTSCDHIAEIAIPVIYGSPSSLESLFKNTKREL